MSAKECLSVISAGWEGKGGGREKGEGRGKGEREGETERADLFVSSCFFFVAGLVWGGCTCSNKAAIKVSNLLKKR